MRRLLLPVLLALPLLTSCRDSKVETYRIAKEANAPLPADTGANAPAHVAGGDMSSMPVARADGRELTWKAPAHWTSKQASSMRKATYIITGADGATAELAITAFPGDVGGDFANVTRWLGQLGLPPIEPSALPTLLTRSESHGLGVSVVDLLGPKQEKTLRMLGAIVPFEGATWFFKLTGPDAVVAAEKPAFLAFLQTIEAGSGPAPAATAAAPAPVSPMAAPAPAADMANTPVIKAEGPGLTWTAPAGWTSKPATAMRKATLLVPTAGGAAIELAVTAFPGDVGGELANVNRWRNQLGLAPLAPADLAGAVTRQSANGLNFAIVDFANGATTNPQRTLGAIVPFNGATWFFKLAGPDASVAAQKSAFLAFLQTVKAP